MKTRLRLVAVITMGATKFPISLTEQTWLTFDKENKHTKKENMIRIKETTNDTIANNIQRWRAKASPENIDGGMTWYDDAMRFSRKLSRNYKVSRHKSAAVISCLSPNNKWERNKYDAEQMISHYREGHKTWEGLMICTYDDNKNKAWRILTEGDHITEESPKTHSFAMNVGRKSPSHVTIDKWHMRASLSRPRDGITNTQESPTKLQYKRLEGITLEIARMHKLKGYELQAIIWLTIKEAWNR